MKITAFASGAGTTLAHLLETQKQLQTPWQITSVISDQNQAAALAVAKAHGILPIVISPKSFVDAKSYEVEMLKVLTLQKPSIILLLGYLKQVSIGVVREYAGRIFNTHPSLLPKYGGKGMYGRYVHQSVITAKERETGVTIHQVSENYDEGKIIMQKKVVIESNWSADDVEKAVKSVEKSALVEFLNSISHH